MGGAKGTRIYLAYKVLHTVVMLVDTWCVSVLAAPMADTVAPCTCMCTVRYSL